ncbi:MAG: HAD-IA family hydrolase [Patescibacteria group bacterium]
MSVNFLSRINALNNKFSFLPGFDVQIFSYEVGDMKPDPKIFQTLIDKPGCLPADIVFTDDKNQNVLSAQSLGINAFVYQGFDHFIDKIGLGLLQSVV